jgi:hypothetical protein
MMASGRTGEFSGSLPLQVLGLDDCPVAVVAEIV